MAARSSTATRLLCIADSTSAPTRSRSTARRGIPHHLIDIARSDRGLHGGAVCARRGTRPSATSTRRGRLPILVGGTGFYYRALTRGLFPGPGADAGGSCPVGADWRAAGPERLHAMLRRIDPPSADRIMPRDQKRLVRALEVYLITGRPLTEHFAATESPIADCDGVRVCARDCRRQLTAERVARRVRRAVLARHRRGSAAVCWRPASRRTHARSAASSIGR